MFVAEVAGELNDSEAPRLGRTNIYPGFYSG